MKIHSKKKALALAAASLLSIAAAGSAQAYVMSGSVVDLTNFQILGSDGFILDATGANTATPTGDFAALTFTSTADMQVKLGGVSVNDPGGSAPINYAPICIGSACPGVIVDDAFPHLTAAPVGNYATADQIESGGPIANIPGGTFPSPAHIGNAAYTGLDSGTWLDGDAASSTSNNNLNSSFSFTLTQDSGITFEFDADAFLQVAMTADELFPGFATASYQVTFSLSLQDNVVPFWSWNPDLFGNGVASLSLNAPLLGGGDVEGTLSTAGIQHFSSSTIELTAGTNYQLSARVTTLADAGRIQAVPEPLTLSLLGIGLLGMGAARRRRQSRHS